MRDLQLITSFSFCKMSHYFLYILYVLLHSGCIRLSATTTCTAPTKKATQMPRIDLINSLVKLYQHYTNLFHYFKYLYKLV